MSSQNRRIEFEKATAKDGKEILQILEEKFFSGKISLLYTRRPDAYLSFQKEGNVVDIVVGRDQKNGKIAIVGVSAIRKVWLKGKITELSYLFSLRMAQEYRNSFPFLHRAYGALREVLQERKQIFSLTTILEENLYARKLLEKKRSFMPIYEPLGWYKVFSLKGKQKNGQKKMEDSCFRKATKEDLSPMMQFLKKEGQKRDFFPVIEEANLVKEFFFGIKLEDFYLLLEDEKIIAIGALWDQKSYKQYIVKQYQGFYKYLYPISSFLPFFGLPELPKIGEILDFRTLSFWIVQEENPEIFSRFLNFISKKVDSSSFFLVGILEQHPLFSLLDKRPALTYRSRVYKVYQKEDQEKVSFPFAPNSYLECGML